MLAARGRRPVFLSTAIRSFPRIACERFYKPSMLWSNMLEKTISIILAGGVGSRLHPLTADHISRTDYDAVLQYHHDSGSDLTVACLTVSLDEARSVGVMTVDAEDRIVSFHEKPGKPRSIPGDPGHALASMGVYVFSMKLL